MAGDMLGFSREQMAFLSVANLRRALPLRDAELRPFWRDCIEANRRRHEAARLVSLPSVIASEQDFAVIHHHTAQPNYVTCKTVHSRVVRLAPGARVHPASLQGQIVAIESADPGYDWIFSADIRGLITCYGGAASHMAIRCAEFGIPAAIGCGPALFRQVNEAAEVLLDCESGHVMALGRRSEPAVATA